MAYDNLARKGRYGDTKIREVAGRKSHVNAKEAGLIDLYGARGEALVQRVGSGTVNPKTGFLEYHWNDLHGKPSYYGGHTHDPVDSTPLVENVDAFDKKEYTKALQEGTGDKYLTDVVGIPEDKVKYFESDVNLDYIKGEGGGFLQRKQDLAKTGLEAGKEFTMEGVRENLRAATTSYEIGRRQTGLLAGKSLFDIKQQVEGQQAQSGFAYSGAVAATGRRAQKGVMADYNLQQKELASQMTGARTAFGLGATQAQSTYDIGMDEAGLAYETGISDVTQQAGEEFWKTMELHDLYE